MKYDKAKDRVTFRKIMKLVDIDSKKIAIKSNVLHFFSLPNFLEVVVVDSNQEELPANLTMRAERTEQAEVATRKESWFTNTPTTKIADDYISELDET